MKQFYRRVCRNADNSFDMDNIQRYTIDEIVQEALAINYISKEDMITLVEMEEAQQYEVLRTVFERNNERLFKEWRINLYDSKKQQIN